MRIFAFSAPLSKVALFVVGFLLMPICYAPSFVEAQEPLEDEMGTEEYALPPGTSDEYVEERVDTDISPQDIGIQLSAPFTVTPVVANEKAKPRDIIKKELVVTNNTAQRIDLYITVENIDPVGGAQQFESPSSSNLSTSLANWIEITRGVIELSAGESRKIPYLIHVNVTAKPGSYFARIQFNQGSLRKEAEEKREGSALMLNVEVFDDAKERLQLGNFLSNDSVVFGNSVSFSYLLENVGNRLIEPRGSIRIFNRRGEEVGSVPLNADGEEILPENKKQLATAWSTVGRFGKYKAYLDLEYGENQLASVQDTVYFWVFPWKEIFASLVGVFVLAVFGTYIVHMRAIAEPVRSSGRTARSVPEAPPVVVEPEQSPQVSQKQDIPRATVLSLGRQTPQEEKSALRTSLPKRQGVQVQLQSRKTKPQVHGNVIQLSSRG